MVSGFYLKYIQKDDFVNKREWKYFWRKYFYGISDLKVIWRRLEQR